MSCQNKTGNVYKLYDFETDVDDAFEEKKEFCGE